MSVRTAFATLLLIVSLPAAAGTSVWHISSGEQELYLAGTIHLLRQQDFPLPQPFENAYENADMVVFEADFTESAVVEFQHDLLARGLYPEGQSLRDRLRPGTWQSLVGWCNHRGVPIELLEQMRAELAMVNIELVELAQMGVNQIGIDFIYMDRARADGKPRGQLETPQQQLDALFSLPPGKEDELVRKTLEDIERTPAMMSGMLAAWRTGNVEELEHAMLDPMREYPEVYESLLVKRNEAWLPLLQRLLLTPETELVLVGVGHLIGPDGLLHALAERGFTVAQYSPRAE